MGIDRLAVGINIEQAAGALNRRLQKSGVVQGDADDQVFPCPLVTDLKVSTVIFNLNCPPVTVVRDVSTSRL